MMRITMYNVEGILSKVKLIIQTTDREGLHIDANSTFN